MRRNLFRLSLATSLAVSLVAVAAVPASAIQPRFPKCVCISPTTPRGADSKDFVCVYPDSRAHILQENSAAPRNRVSSTDITCKSGFVWRDAFDGDAVCVIPSARDRVHNENAHWNANADSVSSGNAACRQ